MLGAVERNKAGQGMQRSQPLIAGRYGTVACLFKMREKLALKGLIYRDYGKD